MSTFSKSDSEVDNLLGWEEDPTSPGNQSTSERLDPGAVQSSTAITELVAAKAEEAGGIVNDLITSAKHLCQHVHAKVNYK